MSSAGAVASQAATNPGDTVEGNDTEGGEGIGSHPAQLGTAAPPISETTSNSNLARPEVGVETNQGTGTQNANEGRVSTAEKFVPGMLKEGEYYWRDRQKWLEERGYMLRPRYRPGWKPSWEGTKKWYSDCEDGLSIRV